MCACNYIYLNWCLYVLNIRINYLSWGKQHCFSAVDYSHYENTPMQYTAIFSECKNDNFQMKKVDDFLIFALNINRGYTLEPPQ